MVFIRKIRFLLTLPLLIITLVTSPVAKSTETVNFISRDVTVFEEALLMGQGIATDGEYYYTSGAITALNLTSIAKFTTDNLTLIDRNINPLPKKCSDRGNNHIGGISVYNDKIYASVEGGDECYACIVTFDCETLEATGEVYDLPNELYGDGVPWCAVDSETGYLYASKWNGVTQIHVYDVNNSMKYIRSIDVDEISRIQGGEFYNGTLYLSNDTKNNGNFKNIYAVNVETGALTVAAVRDVGGENIEAEGLTFLSTDDGAVMHVLDYNKAIGVFLNHYSFAEETK